MVGLLCWWVVEFLLALGNPEISDVCFIAHERHAEYFERTANSLCGNAVREYIHEVASSGKAPSAASLWLYFNSLAGGRIRPPESGRRISINLNEFENEEYSK